MDVLLNVAAVISAVLMVGLLVSSIAAASEFGDL